MERLLGVARTGREEPARRWPPVRRALVPVDRRQQPDLHTGRGSAWIASSGWLGSMAVLTCMGLRCIGLIWMRGVDRASGPAPCAVDRTSVRQRWAERRSRAGPGAAAPSAGGRPTVPAAGGEVGCGRRRNRRRVRSRTPCSTAPSVDRKGSCTTTTCCGSAYRHDGGVRTRRARGSGSSSRQASAALGAPVLEHGAPGAGAHSGAKAVLAGTTAVVGLERTLQRRPPRRPGHDDQAGWSGTLTRLDQGSALPRTPTAQG